MAENKIYEESEQKKIERELISDLRADLRDEASEAKKCFTTFSFQTIAFSAAIIGFIFKSIPNDPISALAAIPGISFLMIVCRIGIYKYQTANRSYGYQFYLEQYGNFQQTEEAQKAWELIVKNKSWEQVFRAWRIIHPTIFKRIYVTPESDRNWMFQAWDSINPTIYRYSKFIRDLKKSNSKTDDNNKTYFWCFLKDITNKEIEIKNEKKDIEDQKNTELIYSEYKSGTYLKNMLLILFILQGIFLLCLLLANIVIFDDLFIERKLGINIFIPLSFIIMLLITIFRIIRTDRRRNIIENELYSIHSCEITWQIIALAHYRATMKSNNSDEQSNTYNWYSQDKIYLDNIGIECKKIIENIFCLDEWINHDNLTQIAPKPPTID